MAKNYKTLTACNANECVRQNNGHCMTGAVIEREIIDGLPYFSCTSYQEG